MLITGGAGFIGSNLARYVVNDNHDVRVLDDLSTGFKENLADLECDLIVGSILDQDTLRTAMLGVDCVVHLAALGSVPRSIKDPVATHEVNARGTLNVLLAARDTGVQHVSLASSSSVYGLNPAMPKDERQWVRPMSPYAVSKLAAEQYALAFQQSYGLDTVAFRFFNVYGPYQRAGHPYAAVIPIFIDKMLSGQALPVNGDGSNSRDFTFVATVCEILYSAAIDRVSSAEPVNLAFGTNTNLLELAEMLGEITTRKVIIEHRPPRAGDVAHSQAANDSLRRLFPHVRATGLSEGLRKTVDWFEEELR